MGGVLLVLAGVSLLIHGGASNAERLARVAGILIIVGLVAALVGALGRM